MILKKILSWAKEKESIQAIIQVGSMSSDPLSDIDLSIFCFSYDWAMQSDSWMHEIDKVCVYIPEKLTYLGKSYSTRLVIFEGGSKIDFAFYPIDLLSKLDLLPPE